MTEQKADATKNVAPVLVAVVLNVRWHKATINLSTPPVRKERCTDVRMSKGFIH